MKKTLTTPANLGISTTPQLISLGLCISALLLSSSLADNPPTPSPVTPALPNPALVAKAKDGQLEEVNAGWWPNLFPDATEALQEAFNTGAKRVIIPNLGQPYRVRPLFLRSDHQKIIFEPNVRVIAAKGAFHGKNDCLITITNRTNITIQGNGATLQMNKGDYQGQDYATSEWRMGISILGSEQVLIEDLHIEETGGDGIYLAPATFHSPPYPENSIPVTRRRKGVSETVRVIPACRNITIRNVTARGNHRQGLSIISAENVLIENCLFEATSGTGPAAGFDIEPNDSYNLAKNIVVRNSVSRSNDGSGFLVYLRKMTSESEPVSILFEGCEVQGSRTHGLVVGAIGDKGVAGRITFKDCKVENTGGAGIYVFDKDAERAHVVFENCKLSNVATADTSGGSSPEAALSQPRTGRRPPQAPIVFFLRRLPDLTNHFGGITFLNCSVTDQTQRPLIAQGAAKGAKQIRISSIDGTITPSQPNATIDLGEESSNITLQLIQ